MSSLVPKKQKNVVQCNDESIAQAESQSKIPCPPKLQRSRVATRKPTKSEVEEHKAEPAEVTIPAQDSEMDMDPTITEMQGQEENVSDQESLKVLSSFILLLGPQISISQFMFKGRR